ncbi:hypothetical protein BASA82_000174 [Batrachochytrium salamandrivorans]|nr:hypothetical protein BASA82_000174 [Batrachochytrium salamandrivorans]
MYLVAITSPSKGSSPHRYSKFLPQVGFRAKFIPGPRNTLAPFSLNSLPVALATWYTSWGWERGRQGETAGPTRAGMLWTAIALRTVVHPQGRDVQSFVPIDVPGVPVHVGRTHQQTALFREGHVPNQGLQCPRNGRARAQRGNDKKQDHFCADLCGEFWGNAGAKAGGGGSGIPLLPPTHSTSSSVAAAFATEYSRRFL